MFSIKYTMERLATTKTGPNDVSRIIWAIGEGGYYKNGSKRCVTHRLGNRYFYFYFILIFSVLIYVLLYIYDVFYEIHDGEAGYYKNGSK